jgi:hypothetical protein
MLRIRLGVTSRFELVPTEYTLIDDKYQGFTQNVKSKKYYFNANYLKEVFRAIGHFVRCILDEK